MSKIFPLTGWGGVPLWKFFSSLNMYQAKSSVKIFSLYWGGVPLKNFFFSLNMYQAKSGIKIFSLYWGGPLKNFFSSLNMYQAKSGVKNFSLYWGAGGVCHSVKIFFFQSEHVSSQTAWLKIFHFTPCGYLAYLRSYSHLNIVKYKGMY